jgi:hypothetical protein
MIASTVTSSWLLWLRVVSSSSSSRFGARCIRVRHVATKGANRSRRKACLKAWCCAKESSKDSVLQHHTACQETVEFDLLSGRGTSLPSILYSPLVGERRENTHQYPYFGQVPGSSKRCKMSLHACTNPLACSGLLNSSGHTSRSTPSAKAEAHGSYKHTSH